MRKIAPYYRPLKRQARRLVKTGISKTEASMITGVSYPTVVYWTSDMRLPCGRKSLSGFTLRILKEIVSKGYAFHDGSQTNGSYRVLRKSFPVRKARSHNTAVFYLEGSERKAMEAFLKRLNLRSISWQELEYIRRAFGIKREGK